MADVNWKDFSEQKRLFNQDECLDGLPGLSESEVEQVRAGGRKEGEVTYEELETFLSSAKEWLTKNRIDNTVSTGSVRWIKYGTIAPPFIMGGGIYYFPAH